MTQLGEIIYSLGRPERVIERVLITIAIPPTHPESTAAPAPIQYYALKTEPVEDRTAHAQA